MHFYLLLSLSLQYLAFFCTKVYYLQCFAVPIPTSFVILPLLQLIYHNLYCFSAVCCKHFNCYLPLDALNTYIFPCCNLQREGDSCVPFFLCTNHIFNNISIFHSEGVSEGDLLYPLGSRGRFLFPFRQFSFRFRGSVTKIDHRHFKSQ